MSRLAELVSIIDKLRGPGGCPWDRAQTTASMRPYLLEECYELLERLDAGEDPDEELGDLLFVVLLLTRIRAESGGRGIEGIAGGVADKMVRRHPHVFADGDAPREAAPGGIAAWEARKAREVAGGLRHRLAGVPRTLPALLRAHRQGEKAASVGFDWPDVSGVLAKVREELDELEQAIAAGDAAEQAHELGDLLMAVASLGRHLDTPPEAALRDGNDRFARRFAEMELRAHRRGDSLADLDAADLDALWRAVKAGPGPAAIGG